MALRIAQKIRVKKVGGTLYYNKQDVKKLVEEGYWIFCCKKLRALSYVNS